MKMQIFDVRWVFSSFKSVKALLRGFPALFTHFEQLSSMESHKTGKERQSTKDFQEIIAMFFVAEASKIKDALQCLKQLFLFTQTDEANIMHATSHTKLKRQITCNEKRELYQIGFTVVNTAFISPNLSTGEKI